MKTRNTLKCSSAIADRNDSLNYISPEKMCCPKSVKTLARQTISHVLDWFFFDISYFYKSVLFYISVF